MTVRNVYLDLLKFMAIFVMILDHVGYYLLSDDLITTHVIRGIGRLAMPLFFITHGYLLAQRPHPPSFSKSVKFLSYGAFLTLSIFVLTNDLGIDILVYFALIDAIWFATPSNTHDKNLMLVLFLYFVGTALCISYVIDILTGGVDMGKSYGVYPLLYAFAGLILGVAPFNKTYQNISILLLVTTLSFEYNPLLFLLFSLSVDISYIYNMLPTLIIPFLFWYIPKANIELTALRSPIALVSRNALNIYVVHLMVIIAIRLALPL